MNGKREIKFRVWDKLLRKFLSKCEMTDITLNFYGDKQDCSLNEMIFQQFTDLKDKNGKEIYEGDIVAWEYKDKTDISQIKFKDGCFVVERLFGNMLQSLVVNEEERIVVVGNIFENPELLKN